MKIVKYLFLFSIALTVIACSDMKEKKHARIIWDKYDNGNDKTVHQYFTDTADMTEDYYYQEFHQNGKLKIQGLENQRVRKGEWVVYYDDGVIKGKLNFDNDKLNGPIQLYDKKGSITAKDIAENGHLKQSNDEVLQFVIKYFDSEQRPVWTDSMNIIVDSLRNIINKE